MPPRTSPFQTQSVFAPERRRARTAQLPDCRRAGDVSATDSLCQDSYTSTEPVLIKQLRLVNLEKVHIINNTLLAFELFIYIVFTVTNRRPIIIIIFSLRLRNRSLFVDVRSLMKTADIEGAFLPLVEYLCQGCLTQSRLIFFQTTECRNNLC